MKRHQNQWLSLNEYDIDLRIGVEQHKANRTHGGFNSWHELYAVLKEELDEFWQSVKDNDPDPQELLQIAAVAKTGLLQLCEFAREESGWLNGRD